ncbi:nuclear cap-binding protein subunit 1 [Blastomyces parvus]|uniref:Nuclear cap-binding protein subunit 1 n=1 Tax=Blastomyces parvus TaxID=2060905 RepID=A0A2B7WM85_9EURO|nr:nuclear cap-binding protein subunit 1 [Blastomyces parvus]
MVDYESRGPPRGGHNRKRRYRDDDDYERRQQRRRYEEPLAVTVRKQLATIAESAVRRAEDDVVRIAKTVSEHYDDEDEEVKHTFMSLVLELVDEQPLKIPFVAATVLTANTMKPELAAEVLKKAGEIAQSHIEAGNWRHVKLVLRFLACLQGLFEGEGMFPLLEELFSRAVDLQTASSEDSLGLELVKIILFTIPYVMASSASGFETQASALLEKTDIIASTPHTLEALVDPLPSDELKEENRMSVIGLLQKQLQEEARLGWELTCIPRPWTGLTSTTKPAVVTPEGDEEKADEMKEEKEEKEPEDPLKNATKHAFPTIAVPNPVPNGPKSIFPDVYFSVYFDQDLETVPPTTDIAASLLRDALTDTIDLLDFNRIATAKFLIDVDCYFAPKTFIKRATPFDKIRDAVAAGTGDRSTWKPEDVAVDAVFSLLFQLPTPQHKLVYYHSVLTEACKIAPAAIAPSLGRAIRFLYKNVARMDLALSYRFLDWFAHHLSNFGFTWKWTEWIDDVELPAVHPKKAFICAALDKEIRLSFAQRIKGTLPEPYQALISEGKEKDTPDFKYALETTPFATEAQEIMQLIRKKAPESEIEPHILAIQQAAASQPDIADPLIPSTDAFVTSICYVGSKSLSHVLSCIERSKERLLAIGPKSPAARRQIITSVLSYWADQPGIGVNIIDKLLNYTILTPLSVIEWALVDHLEGGAALAKAHVYEMVAATMGKVTNRIRQIVAARVQAGIVEPQLSVIDETLRRERGDVQVMFEVIEGALDGVINGSIESGSGMEDVGEEEKVIIREWATRWRRVFKRLRAVEEAFITEAMARAVPVGTMPPVQPPPQQQPAETGAEPMATEGAADNLDMADV